MAGTVAQALRVFLLARPGSVYTDEADRVLVWLVSTHSGALSSTSGVPAPTPPSPETCWLSIAGAFLIQAGTDPTPSSLEVLLGLAKFDTPGCRAAGRAVRISAMCCSSAEPN
mmetsp:Transcript_47019/g.136714  ORF Transcript_47019/g.136714 Transcript_47019/m.136714 type:complete len:113 (+) Transcript_47019:75-413(+)